MEKQMILKIDQNHDILTVEWEENMTTRKKFFILIIMAKKANQNMENTNIISGWKYNE